MAWRVKPLRHASQLVVKLVGWLVRTCSPHRTALSTTLIPQRPAGNYHAEPHKLAVLIIPWPVTTSTDWYYTWMKAPSCPGRYHMADPRESVDPTRGASRNIATGCFSVEFTLPGIRLEISRSGLQMAKHCYFALQRYNARTVPRLGECGEYREKVHSRIVSKTIFAFELGWPFKHVKVVPLTVFPLAQLTGKETTAFSLIWTRSHILTINQVFPARPLSFRMWRWFCVHHITLDETADSLYADYLQDRFTCVSVTQ